LGAFLNPLPSLICNGAKQNHIDEIKGWDKQMPAPLNWKSLISGKVQAVALAMHSVAGQVTASLDTSSRGTHTGSSRHA